jgi:inner membrane protein
MDNIAHAIVGAAVGRAVGGERVALAGTLGVIAANAPDWTEIFFGWPWPRAQYLLLHRGITHSIIGGVVETVALALILGFALRWVCIRRGWPLPGGARLLAVVAASVASHPLMDWQGSYGLRPFLPWSDRWYYGDFVAIVDAFYWLVPLVALAWGAPRHWRPLAGYGAIWAGTTALLFFSGRAAGWIRVVWVILSLIAVIGWARHWFAPARRQLAATVALLVLAVYAGAQAAASLPVKAALHRAAVRRFGPEASWAALTVAGYPFLWEGLVAGRDTVAGSGWAVPRHLEHPAVRRAITATPDGRAFAVFARFLAATVDSGARRVVRLRDVRYARFGDGWASVTVALP